MMTQKIKIYKISKAWQGFEKNWIKIYKIKKDIEM
ncbi:hypothetical protein CNEO3_50024 [Clostridium neonatale]|nr:hypothetical protein CNEO3_50024 [Clostridium neonatale]CAI3698065.1 hypothetical protein CNEO3_50024 [Clostridium neonatale]